MRFIRNDRSPHSIIKDIAEGRFVNGWISSERWAQTCREFKGTKEAAKKLVEEIDKHAEDGYEMWRSGQ